MSVLIYTKTFFYCFEETVGPEFPTFVQKQ